MFKGLRINLLSVFKLEGKWVGQNKSEHCLNYEKRTN